MNKWRTLRGHSWGSRLMWYGWYANGTVGLKDLRDNYYREGEPVPNSFKGVRCFVKETR